MLPRDVLEKIKRDLKWRSREGKPQDHIVLTREEAECLVALPVMLGKLIDAAFAELATMVKEEEKD
jgi:hypothetical protein